jgi:gliding motility-associated-like protein
MTNSFTRYFKYATVIILTINFCPAVAQLPVCTGPGSGLIYYLSGNSIMQWDPALPFSTTNPSVNSIPYPPGAIGLAVSDNINGPGPSPTFYAADAQFYWYWDGSTWINTGHTAGAVNPGAGGGFIYSLIGSSGQVYKYDGTGNAPLLITIPDFNGEGPYDLVGDCEGNFFILNTTANWLRKYSSTGTLLQTWTTSGGQIGTAGGGMAIIGNTVYYDGTGGLWSGPMVGSTITFTNLGASLGPSDFASCSLGGLAPQTGINDTFYYCEGGPGVQLVSSGQEIDTISWSVGSGNAVITGSGDTVTVTATANSVIYSSSTTVCGATLDTFRIIVPAATVDAGQDDTVYGCGTFLDTLVGSVGGLTAGVNYTYTWTPSGTVVSGGNTLTPSVNPPSATTYTLTVTSTQGGCTWTDSVAITPIDVDVIAGFSSLTNYGCVSDTVIFTNNSQFANSYFWDFGDGSTDTAANPVHVYSAQGNYVVKLVVTNGICYDSVISSIDLNHPLAAQFTVDNDTICQHQSVSFTNTSVTTTIGGVGPEYSWNFGNGDTSAVFSPSYQFTRPGVFEVSLVVKDFVPCFDTATVTIVVDSQSTVDIVVSDTVICAGQKINLEGLHLREGMVSYTWNMADGIVITNEDPVAHTFEMPGLYLVTLAVDYFVCNDSTDEQLITVKPHPLINIGEDTSFCPNAGALVLRDDINIGNPVASWKWSTGDNVAMITVDGPDTYYATVTIEGCSSTDTVTVWKDCYIDIPNSFTPNGDNMNDWFLPRQLLSRSVKTFKMNIYNRWGQEIFTTTNISGRGWDGKFNDEPQQQGVYVYLIELSFADGRSEKYQGNVTLLR